MHMVKPKFCTTMIAGLLAASAALVAPQAFSQGLMNGYWFAIFDEDQPERVPGPDLGDFAGLPVTKAAISIGHGWDPAELTIPEEGCRTHPSLYGWRSVGFGRIWEETDPYTQHPVKIKTWLQINAQHRDIWMEDAAPPHPSPLEPNTWQGFSVAKWVGNQLLVHTDNIKGAWTRRNGLPTTDRATMDEVFLRYGDVMTHIMMVSDPAYLSEPMVKSNEYLLDINGRMDAYPCYPADETPRPEGTVPMYLPGMNPSDRDFATRNKVPVEAADGGAQTMFPEYQDYLKKLPPNPPRAEVDKATQKVYAAQAAHDALMTKPGVKVKQAKDTP
jgi:hypothetical protein